MQDSHAWLTPEECFLCSKDLHSAGRVLGQVEQAACMGDEAGPHQLTHQHCQVGGNGLHPALQVVKQLAPVLCQGYHLKDMIQTDLVTVTA